MSALRFPLRITPKIITAGRFPMPASNSGRDYLHDHYALHQHLYEGTITIGKRRLPFRDGDLTISPPGVATSYEIAKGGTHWCIHFELATPAQGEATFRLPTHFPASGSAAYFKERLRAIAETLRPRSRHAIAAELASAAAGAQLQHLLLLMGLRRGAHGPENTGLRRSDSSLDKVRLELELHFQKRLDVASLAASSGLSRNFFAARFHERFGMTVAGYLFHLRIEMAKSLLLSTSLPIKEVAYECGIPEPNYFNKQFRRATGMNPSLYRARQGG